MPIVKGSLPIIGFTFLFWIGAGLANAQAEPISSTDSMTNESLGDIHAQGMNVGGNLSTFCYTTATSICLGTYVLNNKDQFNALDHNGPNRQPIDIFRLFDRAILYN